MATSPVAPSEVATHHPEGYHCTIECSCGTSISGYSKTNRLAHALATKAFVQHTRRHGS